MRRAVGQPDLSLTWLRRHGERVTRARRAVIEALADSDQHRSADELVAAVEASTPGVHRATVYRALATLGELGLVTHTHIAGAATVYHLSDPSPVGHGHAHVQCTRCHRVFDVSVEALGPLAEQLQRELGFSLEPEHAALLGTCADCRQP